jgi:hypothetical protein
LLLAGVLQSRQGKDGGRITQLPSFNRLPPEWICKIRLIELEETLHPTVQAMAK